MATLQSDVAPATDLPPVTGATGQAPRAGGGKSGAHIYGSFWIDQTELALPVSAIREVVNEPNDISRMPLAPAFLAGLFNLRGMIIPIIDLRILLEFPDWEEEHAESLEEAERKVAIIENGNQCVGVLFDRAGEVLNETGAARVDFRQKEGRTKDVVIDGVLKLDGGARMVQIIDPYEVLNIERVPQAEATAFNADQYSDLGSRLSCVSFQLGHSWCAIDLRYVQEVRDMPPIESSLLSHGSMIGTASLRGDIIPVVDFRSYMGDEPAFKLSPEALSRRKMLLLRTTGGLIGLMVYSIDSIMTFFERDVLPFAKLALPHGDIVKGCLVSDDHELVMLLDHKKLLSDPGLTEPARLCQDVHHVSDAPQDDPLDLGSGTQKIERQTFILFTASSSFAMDTCSVSEVINRPEKVMKPPYALNFVEGIINLRGELITLINLRRLYGMDGQEAVEQKIVIFIHKSRKYAILVDSVDEIVMTTSESVSTDETTGFSGVSGAASADLSGVLSVSRGNKEKAMVMIMGVDALVERCIKASNKAGAEAEFGKPSASVQSAPSTTQAPTTAQAPNSNPDPKDSPRPPDPTL